jgi:hypothetical protein
MILKCISPSGTSCTIRLTTEACKNVAIKLARMGFSEFRLIPEYRKFHTLQYMVKLVRLSRFLEVLNRPQIRSANTLKKEMIEHIIDESQQYGGTH